ncbi:MAG: hypothetical protein H6811_06890 [Phycisphaeraceae bacterium]|nr:hypothetical protein [Phycisphaeraceae bacterium]
MSRFGAVAVVATLLLVLVGGLVTSADAGLAVADWPTTRTANMFLYPLSLMSHPRVFLEHSHRLLGSMVGLSTLVLAVLIAVFDSRQRDRVLGIAIGFGAAAVLGGLMGAATRGVVSHSVLIAAAVLGMVAGLGSAIVGFKRGSSVMVAFALLALVTAQGFLGGTRVTQQSQVLALVHGMLAMVFLSLMVAQATWLRPAWIEAKAVSDGAVRRFRTMSTALLHTLYVQVLLGAMYRHLGSKGMHALFTHAAVSVAVLVLATLCAASAVRAAGAPGVESERLNLGRRWLLVIVNLQMALGIGAMIAVLLGASRGPTPTSSELEQAPAAPLYEVVLSTLHHANGAALVATAMVMFLWARRLWSPTAAGASAGGEGSRK